MDPEMLVVAVVQQPDLTDAWRESQQKVRARVMPGSPPADRRNLVERGHVS